MRGFPFLNLLIALLASGALLLPLVWRSTRAAVAPPAGGTVEAVPGDVAAEVPVHISLRFVHPPAKAKIEADGKVLKEWAAPGGALLLEETASLDLSGGRAELNLVIEWPAGTTDPTNVVVQVEPERREAQKEVVWSSGGTVDDIVILSWKP